MVSSQWSLNFIYDVKLEMSLSCILHTSTGAEQDYETFQYLILTKPKCISSN